MSLRPLVEELESMLAERETLEEKGGASKKNPFKNKKILGPTAMKGFPYQKGRKERIRSKTGDWKCKCSKYKCKCVGRGPHKGETKIFQIKKKYKKKYNELYRAWRKSEEGGKKRQAARRAKK